MTDSNLQKRAILIVDHGTRNEAARATLVRLAKDVARARPDWLVEHAHMELAEPDFDAGVDTLVARGATHIYVHLHFLGAGYHVRESIPALVAKANERHEAIAIETSDPLGHDPRIADLVLDRMDRQARSDRQSSKE
jgi:sirohydrochlorin ferrochelatase